MRRRSFLRSAGVAGAGLAGLGSLGTAAATHRDYRYHGTIPAPSVEKIVTQDGLAFCTSSGGILTVDLSDPTDIQHLTTTETAGTVHKCFFKDGYAYLRIQAGAAARMVIYDLGDPWNPTTLEGEDDAYETYRDVPHNEYGTGGSWMQANVREDLAGTAIHDIYVTEEEGGELAWLADVDPCAAVMDVTDEQNPA